MKYFVEVTELAALEKQEKWEEVRSLLFNQWNSDKNNIDRLLRLMTECWYVLVEWDCCIANEGLAFQQFKETLMLSTEYGLQHFPQNSRFLCMAGYMISLFPYLFYHDGSDSKYLELEHKGKQMLAESYALNPDDPVATVFCLGTKNQDKEYLEAKAMLSASFIDLFRGETAIEQYFRDILTMNK